MLQILAGTAVYSLLLVTLPLPIHAAVTFSSLDKQAETQAAQVGQASQPTMGQTKEFTEYRMLEESNRRLLSLCVMGTAILSLFLVLTYLQRRQASPDTMVNGSGLVLVIFATVLVVILAKADQQLTAATGILGAIAGYLFGKTTKDSGAHGGPGQTEKP